MNEPPNPELPTPAAAAAMLVEASAVDVETDRGETIELWTISCDGPLVMGSGPRLSVAGGMMVTCRLAEGGRPVQVRAVIEEAEYRSQSRASLVLRVIEVGSHGYHRRTERLSVNSSASLRSVVCDRIPPNEVLPVTLTDLSDAGCALSLTDGRLRQGDRMTLSARFLEGEVVADVRVARLYEPAPDVYTAGCSFISMPGTSQVVLERVLGRLSGNARPAADLGALRESFAEESAGANSLKQEPRGADEAYWTFAKRSAARIPTARRAV